MVKFILFTVFITVTLCAYECPLNDYTKSCNQHTNMFEQYQKGYLKKTDFFQSNTYLPGNIDPCTKFGNRKEYVKKLVDNNIICELYCSTRGNNPGNYNCLNQTTGVKTNNCLQVEHMVDSKNSDMVNEGMDVDIYGNIIMANGIWNNQVGGKSWDLVMIEKSDIYGDIFMKAREHIRYCNNIDKKNNFTIIIITIIIIVIGVSIVIVYLYIKQKNDRVIMVGNQIDNKLLNIN